MTTLREWIASETAIAAEGSGKDTKKFYQALAGFSGELWHEIKEFFEVESMAEEFEKQLQGEERAEFVEEVLANNDGRTNKDESGITYCPTLSFFSASMMSVLAASRNTVLYNNPEKQDMVVQTGPHEYEVPRSDPYYTGNTRLVEAHGNAESLVKKSKQGIVAFGGNLDNALCLGEANAADVITNLCALKYGLGTSNIDVPTTTQKLSEGPLYMNDVMRVLTGTSSGPAPYNHALIDPEGKHGLNEEVYYAWTHHEDTRLAGRCPFGHDVRIYDGVTNMLREFAAAVEANFLAHVDTIIQFPDLTSHERRILNGDLTPLTLDQMVA